MKEMIEGLREYGLEKAPNHPVHGYGWADRPAILVLKEGEVGI